MNKKNNHLLLIQLLIVCRESVGSPGPSELRVSLDETDVVSIDDQDPGNVNVVNLFAGGEGKRL